MTKEEISKLYREYNVPLHVVNHMKKVKNICEKLANDLIGKGIAVNKALVCNGALLHDVLRVCDFHTFTPEKFPQKVTDGDIKAWQEIRKKYGKAGHIDAIVGILRKKGEDEIANLIKQHGFSGIDRLNSWEEKILHYADKRVSGDKLVSLEERFSKWIKRDHVYEEKVKILEKEFIKILGKPLL